MEKQSLVKKCLEILEKYKVFAWRNNTGVLFNASWRPVRFGHVGSSDIIGILPRTGRFLAIECKSGSDVLSLRQREFLCKLSNLGGVALVVRHADQLEAALKSLLE